MKELDNIKRSIAEGKTKNSISQFIDFIESKSFDIKIETRAYYDKVILVSGRYRAIENEIRLGIIKKDDELVERNKINNDLLGLVNEFPETSDLTPVSTGESITQRVKKISAQNKFKYDVFLSFSNKDRNVAIKLYESLIGYGLRVFISSEYFKKNIGSSFQNEIEYALKHSRSFLLFWTEHAKQSKWVEIEYMAFFQEFYLKEGKERKFYIFRPEDNFQIELPLFLRQLQFTSSSRELVFSILQEEEFRIKIVNGEKQKTAESSVKVENEKKQRDEAARAKAEKQKTQREEEARANQKRIEDWEYTKNTDTIDSYGKFITKYKKGKFISTARKKLNQKKQANSNKRTMTKVVDQKNPATESTELPDWAMTITSIVMFLLNVAFLAFVLIVIIHLIIYLVGLIFKTTYAGGVWDYVIVIGSLIVGLIFAAISDE